jgi:hypothetical protein
VRIGECGHEDVVDVQVALAAEAHSAAVVTADRDDIVVVSPGLADLVIDI